MKNRRNYYRILHVQYDAPEAVIRASYHTIMHKLRHHPDLGGDHWNATVINEAYAVLSRPERRRRYDRELLKDQERHVSDPPTNTENDPKSTQHPPPGPNKKDGQKAKTKRPSAPSPGPEASDSSPRSSTRRRCPFCDLELSRTLASCLRCSSPLIPVRMSTDTRDGRRQIERLPMSTSVQVMMQWPQKDPYRCTVADLSPNGCKLMLNRDIKPGIVLRLECKLFLALARVRNCQDPPTSPDSFCYGLEFITLTFSRIESAFISIDA